MLKSITGVCEKTLAIVLLLIITALVFIFVRWQFGNKWIAARKIEGLIRTSSNVIKQPSSNDLDWTIDSDFILPKFVVPNIPSKSAFNEQLCQSEFISYGAMAVALIMFVILVAI
jgi:hypothetical protein